MKLVGTDPDKVKEAMTSLLTEEALYKEMSKAPNPYGDGKASERIVQAIKVYFNLEDSVSEFHEGGN